MPLGLRIISICAIPPVDVFVKYVGYRNYTSVVDSYADQEFKGKADANDPAMKEAIMNHHYKW